MSDEKKGLPALAVGDNLIRWLAGKPIRLKVIEVTEDLIICTKPERAHLRWTFDRKTGAEVDEVLGFGPPPRVTGSYIEPMEGITRGSGNVLKDLGLPDDEAEELKRRSRDGTWATSILDAIPGALEQAQEGVRQVREGEGTSLDEWREEADAMFERMQTPSFAEAVEKILDEPMRVRVSQHLKEARPSEEPNEERLQRLRDAMTKPNAMEEAIDEWAKAEAHDDNDAAWTMECDTRAQEVLDGTVDMVSGQEVFRKAFEERSQPTTGELAIQKPWPSEERLKRARQWFSYGDDAFRDRMAAVLMDGMSPEQLADLIARVRDEAATTTDDLNRRYCVDYADRMERLSRRSDD